MLATARWAGPSSIPRISRKSSPAAPCFSRRTIASPATAAPSAGLRRHIRSTRQRIRRLRDLLSHLAVLTDHELDTRTPSSAPFWLAARVIAGGPLLTWPELWDVLRWYAHNRGYDGNAKWSKDRGEEEGDGMNADDTEKLKKMPRTC